MSRGLSSKVVTFGFYGGTSKGICDEFYKSFMDNHGGLLEHAQIEAKDGVVDKGSLR